MSEISRRSFIQKATAGALAAAVVPSIALGESLNPPTNPSSSNNDKKVIGRGTEMKIIQFTDTHLRGDDLLSFGKCDTPATVKKAIDFFLKMPEYDLPDLFIVTGDIADNGNIKAYKKCHEYFKKLPRPVYCLPGNHDKRKDMYDVLGNSFCPIEEDMKPYFCYTIEDKPIRVICVDTIVEGKHWGGITDKVADWLERKLDEQPNKKTLVFTHHPPFETGMGFMDEGFENLERFAEILVKHKHHIRLCCGHMHCNISTTWRGVDIVVSNPICLQMELDFRDGGGDRFFLGDPGFMIHHLYNNTINSHFSVIPTQATYAGPFPFKYLDADLKKV